MKISSTKTILVLAVTAVVLYGGFLFYFIPRDSAQANPAVIIGDATPTPKQTSIGLPLHIKIPVIHVDSVIESVGLTPDGAMGVPKNTTDVAWFNVGPRPGENGTAVIDGHYGISKGKASVFDDLHKLKLDDKIIIQDDKGASVSFVVRRTKTLDPQADATEVFGVNTGPSHLNLITCEGIWNKTTKSYSERLVVFTDKE